jgi:hypothetical protein
LGLAAGMTAPEERNPRHGRPLSRRRDRQQWVGFRPFSGSDWLLSQKRSQPIVFRRTLPNAVVCASGANSEALMLYYAIKLILSATIIVIVSEVAKVNVGLGALIKSLPLISILAMVWLYLDTRDVGQIAALSTSTFWLVLPTLPMFLVLPVLLKNGIAFYVSLGISIGVMLVCYLVALPLLSRIGIHI